MRMLSKYFMLSILFLLLTQRCFSQSIPGGWFTQNSNTNQYLFSVFFQDSQTGYVSADSGYIHKTINGGNSWTSSHPGSDRLTKIRFTSVNTGYVIGMNGSMLKTTDEGESWFQLKVNTENELTDMSFIDNETGYVTGLNETLLKTLNGGQNWYSFSFLDSVDYNSVCFINSLTGWVCTEKRQTSLFDTTHLRLFKTTDGGSTWTPFFHSKKEISPLLNVFFFNSLQGYMTLYFDAASYTHLLKTTDGGINWSSIPLGNDGNYSVFFLNSSTGWASGPNNSLYRTNSGGNSWIRSPAINTGAFYLSVFFTDNLTGWAVGSNGKILKTTTGGVLTNFTNEASVVNEFALKQNYPNPFNPTTKIEFNLPSSGFVSLKVYDVLGNEVASLINEKREAGNHNVQVTSDGLPSGVYFYRLTSWDFVQTRKMMILK